MKRARDGGSTWVELNDPITDRPNVAFIAEQQHTLIDLYGPHLEQTKGPKSFARRAQQELIKLRACPLIVR
ncbi:hypothetical protein KIN20_019024 [Parelaphostrongylus tenuis]|uniref:Uncharacterized protein n=1 Tax=Parelaphostrongylus tenuis TaxID=148309 RepID=A0AAD5MKS9_PARTN|nr:hypothetical protein KIN20_019024 [Parelaphostrongylus tenuis]